MAAVLPAANDIPFLSFSTSLRTPPGRPRARRDGGGTRAALRDPLAPHGTPLPAPRRLRRAALAVRHVITIIVVIAIFL